VNDLPPYLDKNGLIVTLQGDGGDSCANAGTVATLNPDAAVFLSDYVRTQGFLVRHPDATEWYGRKGRFSRDQLVALLCALVMRPSKLWLKSEVRRLHKERLFLFAWNTIRNFVYETEEEHKLKSTPDVPWNMSWKVPDFTGPEVWALWIRVYRLWYLYPVLCVFDIETLIGSLDWRFRRKDRVTRNHLLVTYVSTQVMPTPISYLSKMITPVQNLIERWSAHCKAVGEYDSGPLFRERFK